MISSNRNLLVVFNTRLPDEKAIEQEVNYLNQILLNIESSEQFCIAHELVDRNRITSNRKKIIKETRYFRLKPFRFLINKN
ncbi:MAG: hypothetical protein LH619_01085 [Chitinophagaceae bacterium]|nr:hypothetical protein [Chitinophagaceae bacterium]